MLERNEVSEGAVGQHVDIYDFTDNRLEVRWKGVSLPYVVFDKERVSHAAIVENNRLGGSCFDQGPARSRGSITSGQDQQRGWGVPEDGPKTRPPEPPSAAEEFGR
jgi:hypothetical protein